MIESQELPPNEILIGVGADAGREVERSTVTVGVFGELPGTAHLFGPALSPWSPLLPPSPLRHRTVVRSDPAKRLVRECCKLGVEFRYLYFVQTSLEMDRGAAVVYDAVAVEGTLFLTDGTEARTRNEPVRTIVVAGAAMGMGLCVL